MKRYLVYKEWNGQIHAELQYGEHSTGSDKKKVNDNEKKRIEILDHTLTLEQAIIMYPYEQEIIRQ